MTNDLIEKRLEFERKLEQVKAIISSKDILIHTLQRNEEMLDKEILELKD